MNPEDNNQVPAEDKIIQVNIEEQMKTAYIDYSMSVIVSRALPDVRDGLKPVQRRVLYGMYELGVGAGKPYKKSARIVGEVLGKYHPHGDVSVYDAMVRLAQQWSLRYPLVDGQGNFGSVDGDSPAAMRYTEARFSRIAEEFTEDLEKETVDTRLNFDDSLTEPVVMPTQIPSLLVNGASGIAVGMATNMLPHNLAEVVDGVIAYVDDNQISIADLMKHIKAPDFPTGGIIYGTSGVQRAFLTGRGSIIVRGRTEIEQIGNREQIIVTEIPYQVNKALLIQKTADLVNDKTIEGISDIRDESDRRGMRIVYELKRDANPNVVLNQLFKHTSLQSSFGVNNVCLVNGRPRILNLKELIKYFVEFRHEVVVRRTQFELRKAEERAHILEGLLIALDNLDAVIQLIRKAATPDDARDGLITQFGLSEIQAKAILEMRLQRLTGLERDKIRNEYEELQKHISHLKEVLANESLRMDIIKNELLEIKRKYADKRRTEIEYAETGDIHFEELIEREQVVITISHLGYIKRTSLSEYREQNRGGRGSLGVASREEDFIEHLFVGTTHDHLLMFTEQGRCHWLKVYEVPEGTKQSKGRAVQNVLNLATNDKVRAYITVKSLADEAYINNHYLVFCTVQGQIKKTTLEAFSRPRSNGIQAITINEGDRLLEVKLTNGQCNILIGVKSGNAIRFPENKVRPMGRTAAGVRGIDISGNDEVIGMVCVDTSAQIIPQILSVSENGYGKRTELDEYRITNRGGKGVKALNVTAKTGALIAILEVDDTNGLMIINKSGITLRTSVEAISVTGRATQGVRLINIADDDSIASVAKIPTDDSIPTTKPDAPDNNITTEEP